MASIRTSIIAGFALLVAAGSISIVPARAQLLTSAQLAAYEASKGQSPCPQTLDQSHQKVRQLAAAATRIRAMAEENPVYWADVGYYETELAFAKKCVQSVAAMKRVAR
jgi:hypothetical protein